VCVCDCEGEWEESVCIEMRAGLKVTSKRQKAGLNLTPQIILRYPLVRKF